MQCYGRSGHCGRYRSQESAVGRVAGQSSPGCMGRVVQSLPAWYEWEGPSPIDPIGASVRSADGQSTGGGFAVLSRSPLTGSKLILLGFPSRNPNRYLTASRPAVRVLFGFCFGGVGGFPPKSSSLHFQQKPRHFHFYKAISPRVIMIQNLMKYAAAGDIMM